MIFYFPRKSINLKDYSFNKNDINNVMKISLPATSSKIIGSIAYFLEPIVLTNVLLFMGYTKNYIIYEYGIINAYALSLLLMPQFLTQNMSSSLVPELSKYYSQSNTEMCKKRIKQIVLISSSIGVFSTLIITIFPTFFLDILYHTNEGIDYIRLLSPFTILFYIEYPLTNALQALGKSTEAMKCTIISSIIRLFSIALFSLLKIGMYSLVISIIINLISSTYLNYREIKKALS
jgi:stage V sporulation protein B